MLTRKSNPNKPVRVLIYGETGVGKSTFGAKSERPVFITPEGGTDRLTDAQGNLLEEMEGCDTWDGVSAAIDRLIKEEHAFKTLCIDSLDWLEKLCHAKIIGNSGLDIIRANKGYGAGYRESEIKHRGLIEKLSSLRESRNMNIVLIAHAHVKPVKDPEVLSDYDSYEIKCHEMVSSLWREWVDALFFARFETLIKPGEDTSKARAVGDGTRVVYTEKRPAYQAKNRYGMKPSYPFTEKFWSTFLEITRKGIVEVQVTADQLREQIAELSKLVTDEKIKKTIDSNVEKAGEDKVKLKFNLDRLKEITGRKE